MNVFFVKILLYTLVISKYQHVLQNDERQRWVQLCHDDYMKCPNCFDESNKFCCDLFLDNVRIPSSIEFEVSSLFGNRKIQFGAHNQRNAVLKYLVNDENLDDLRRKCNENFNCENLWMNQSNAEQLKSELLRAFRTKESVAGFQICPADSVTRFLKVFSQQSIYALLLLNINVEPMIMTTLRSRQFPVPQLYDSCGFVTIQSNNGLPLYSFFDQSFAVRLLIAKNLLAAALKFSYGVEGFRIYLTDATPDNIVVDATTFDVTFVDLDNVFMVDSSIQTNSQLTHRHEKIDCDGICFAYVPEELCSYHLSDINLFAVCQMFVEDANRMPNEGLLHSIPDTISSRSKLQQLVNQCVNGSSDDDNGDRFVTVSLLLELFNKILVK